jgi:carbonic anhydrase
MGALDLPPAPPPVAAGPRATSRAVITCMDPRVHPIGLLPASWDGAVEIRNAGGLVTRDVVDSLLLAHRALGIRRVAVVHHTDCAALADRAPGEPVDEVLRRSVTSLLQSPDIRHGMSVRGFVHDLDRGSMREVSALWWEPQRTETVRAPAPGTASGVCARCGRRFPQAGSVLRGHRSYCSDICRSQRRAAVASAVRRGA